LISIFLLGAGVIEKPLGYQIKDFL